MSERHVGKRWSLLGMAVFAMCSLSVRLLERIPVSVAWRELTGSGEFSLSLAGEQAVVRFGRRVHEFPRARRFCGCRPESDGCCKMVVIRPNDLQATNPLLTFWGPCDADVLELMSWEVTKVWLEPPAPGRSQRFKTYDINHEFRLWSWNGETYTSTPAGYW